MTTRHESVRSSHRMWCHVGHDEFTIDPTQEEQSDAQALGSVQPILYGSLLPNVWVWFHQLRAFGSLI